MYFEVTYIRYSGAFSLFLFIYFSWLCWRVVHINSRGRLEVSVTMGNWKLAVGSWVEDSLWLFQGSSAICTPLVVFVVFVGFFFSFQRLASGLIRKVNLDIFLIIEGSLYRTNSVYISFRNMAQEAIPEVTIRELFILSKRNQKGREYSVPCTL